MNSPQENDPYREDRIALLRYYNSQCMTHAGYFVSMLVGLVIALSTLLSEWQKIAEVTITFESIMIPVALIIFAIIIVILLFGCLYALVGALYWGYLASGVMHISVTQEEKNKYPIPMSALHNVTSERVGNFHPNIVTIKSVYNYLLDFYNFCRNRKQCNYCGKMNKRDSISCSKCGKQFPKTDKSNA